jgi:16S rRNA C967 or C1407 C5-methylase (RsmB/RsmF family)
MSKASGANKGREGFEAHYAGVYGERWSALREALLAPVRQVARVNRFTNPESIAHRLLDGDSPRSLARFGACEALVLEPGERIETRTDASGLFDFYVMDPASIFAASALEVRPGDEVLDLCAAPGGKSLVLAEALGAPHIKSQSDLQSTSPEPFNQRGRLVANEMSDKRRARLRAVLEDYLPSSLRERVSVTGHDGARWCLHETEAFDRILVDAPCSGERHLLEDPAELKLWSPARSKNLAVRQYALLVSALQVVRPGGRLVYSTCSISPLENDAVIARLLKKREGEAKVIAPHFEIGEATEHGWMILPDRTGYGPIYFAVLERSVSA